jgi:serine/threonine protein kinase
MNSRFELGEVIGRGAVGIVHRGRQLRPERPVAIKVLRPEMAEDEAARSRFLREAEICAQLNHPGIVQIYDVVDDLTVDGRPAIVMELLEGQTLRERMGNGPLSLDEAVEIALQVLAALGHAHACENGAVVHRDIKPANIFLCGGAAGTPRVKVADFGIAHVASAAALTKTGAPIGTPEYMSPEQALGKRADTRSDLYALGVMMYEMLCGQTPFQAETAIGVIYAHVHHQPPPLPETIPPHIRQAVERSLRKEPEARFTRADEFAVALKTPLKELPVSPAWIRYAAAAAIVLGIAGSLWPRHSVSTIQVAQAIPFQTKIQPTMALPLGKERITQPGRNGLRRQSYNVTYRSSLWSRAEVERRAQGAPVLETQPVTRLVQRGVREEISRKSTQEIAFKTEQRYTRKLGLGKTRLARPGRKGRREVLWELVYRNQNGKRVLVDRVALTSRVVQPPVNAILEMGTFVPPEKPDYPESGSSNENNSYSIPTHTPLPPPDDEPVD